MSDNRTTELLPCPFCGGVNVKTSFKDTLGGDFRRGVYCADCRGGIYPYFDTEAEAIAAWNARAERTCKPDEDDCCSCCGEDLVRCNVGIGELGGAVELDPPIYHNFCPNCGARVIE